MSRKKTEIGICRICKKEKQLTFEHIPPRVAFNKNTRYYSIPYNEFVKSPNFIEHKPKGIVHQGGIGYHTLCGTCNEFLNKHYVRSFSKWANIGMSLNSKFDFKYIEFTAMNQNPFRVLKQIISMFISMNEPWFTKEYVELLDFIKNPELKTLSYKYKVYHYLNNEGQIRNLSWAATNTHGIVCELTFPPFGYILNINNSDEINHLTEISGWKNYTDERNHSFDIGLYKYPTYLPIPLDYRTKEEIEKKYDTDKKASRQHRL